MLSIGIQYQPYTVIPALLLGSDFGVLGWVTCGVEMMWLCRGWGLQPPQTASHIHIGHIRSDWAYWYAVHLHTVAALHSFTHPTRLRFWGTWSLLESKWCILVMVDAESHLKLLPTSMLDTYKMIEHIDMLSMGIQYQPYTGIPTLLGSDFGILGHLWSQNDVIMSWLRLTATSNCFPHPYWTYTKYLSTLVCYPLAYSVSLTQLYPHYYLGQILGSGSLVESKWCDYVMDEADSHLKPLPISILDI